MFDRDKKLLNGILEINSTLYFLNHIKTSFNVCDVSCGFLYWSFNQAYLFSSEIFLSTFLGSKNLNFSPKF